MGLLDKNFVAELKSDGTFNESSFAREYESVWSGTAEDAFFNAEMFDKHREIKHAETEYSGRTTKDSYYLLSVDVGRISDQTVCSVFRVNIINDKYYATLVNLFVLGTDPKRKPFQFQAIDLKKIIKAFNPRQVVIDTNGLGVGLGDEMIRPQYDEFGEYYPPYGFINDDVYRKVQPKDALCILYGIKANGPLNSKIHGNVYSRISSGMVKFLIKEQEAKSALMSTKQGQKMSMEKRIKRLMPHEMTTKLFEEMANLRLKKTGNSMDIVLEQINSRFPKDKYSSFAYGLWRIKEIEEETNQKKRRRSGLGGRKLTFFTEGA